MDGPLDVLAAVGTRGDALGVVPLASDDAWWQALEAEDAPNVIARLPFVERKDHPAGTPCLVVANAPIDPQVMAATLVSIRLSDKDTIPSSLLPPGIDILAQHKGRTLISAPDTNTLSALRASFGEARMITVGSHAPVFHA